MARGRRSWREWLNYSRESGIDAVENSTSSLRIGCSFQKERNMLARRPCKHYPGQVLHHRPRNCYRKMRCTGSRWYSTQEHIHGSELSCSYYSCLCNFGTILKPRRSQSSKFSTEKGWNNEDSLAGMTDHYIFLCLGSGSTHLCIFRTLSSPCIYRSYFGTEWLSSETQLSQWWCSFLLSTFRMNFSGCTAYIREVWWSIRRSDCWRSWRLQVVGRSYCRREGRCTISSSCTGLNICKEGRMASTRNIIGRILRCTWGRHCHWHSCWDSYRWWRVEVGSVSTQQRVGILLPSLFIFYQRRIRSRGANW